MKTPEKHPKLKAVIDLPANKIWRDLQKYGMDVSNGEYHFESIEDRKKIEHLLDLSFKAILNKLVRQN